MANTAYKSDIEIAQSAKMLPICDVAKNCGIDCELLENYGKYKAKIDYAPVLKRAVKRANSCLSPQSPRRLRARVKPPLR